MGTVSIHEGVRRMRFSSLLDRTEAKELTQAAASELLGINVRTWKIGSLEKTRLDSGQLSGIKPAPTLWALRHHWLCARPLAPLASVSPGRQVSSGRTSSST